MLNALIKPFDSPEVSKSFIFIRCPQFIIKLPYIPKSEVTNGGNELRLNCIPDTVKCFKRYLTHEINPLL